MNLGLSLPLSVLFGRFQPANLKASSAILIAKKKIRGGMKSSKRVMIFLCFRMYRHFRKRIRNLFSVSRMPKTWSLRSRSSSTNSCCWFWAILKQRLSWTSSQRWCLELRLMVYDERATLNDLRTIRILFDYFNYSNGGSLWHHQNRKWQPDCVQHKLQHKLPLDDA